MGRKANVRTAKELLEAAERTLLIRAAMQRAGAKVTEVAFYAGISTQSLYAWLREGLSEPRYYRLIDAVEAVRKAREAGR